MIELTPAGIINKKNTGNELSAEEISFMIGGFLKKKVNDFQISGFLCSLYHKGMSEGEIFALTIAMASHGHKLDLTAISAPKIDKHSTGGVGDGVSLILVPLASSLGIIVPSMAGRSLGFTGGTIDKLESIPGINTSLTSKAVTKQLLKIGCSIFAQTSEIAPADKKIYAIRDQIACVDSMGLIISSILSKKIAESITGLVLDLKFGLGAFMQSYEEAKKFASIFGSVSKKLGIKSAIYITDMDQPLGKKIGNALEIEQAREILSGGRDPLYSDVRTLAVELTARMLVMAGFAAGKDEARGKAEAALLNGSALAKFKALVTEQGGDAGFIEDSSKLPKANNVSEIRSEEFGYIKKVDARKIAQCLAAVGAVGNNPDVEIDRSAGVVLEKKYGDFVSKDDVLGYIHHNYENNDSRAADAKKFFLEAFYFSQGRVKETNLVKEICVYE